MLQLLDFNGADEYKVAERHIWRVDSEIAGYVKEAANLTEVLVRRSGHMRHRHRPTHQPMAESTSNSCLQEILQSWNHPKHQARYRLTDPLGESVEDLGI
ncbi:hypothetical protein NQ318_010637 [Aromia moschata]|uniref:Uncharacterized protein n=1 Tax=Aromia moschata TaxID=1265417 RepID=A0AAV8XAC4_9CUCU|nr:hypothetical protein NQ318_010637 [Aromia moschata]